MEFLAVRRVLLVLLAFPLVGCAGEKSSIRMEAAPPAPPPARIQPRPGHVFVQGHWHRNQNHGDWEWNDGYWVPQKPGQTWVDGRWVDAGGYWRWESGRWAPQPDDQREPPGL